jgi:hypothetical protein
MVALAYSRKGYARRTPKAAPPRRMPPSANLISLVLEHADLRDDIGGGRTLMRLSPDLLGDPRIRLQLGVEAARAADVAVIWDEREDQIFRVLDGASAKEDRFVLTPAAEAYIAAYDAARGE